MRDSTVEAEQPEDGHPRSGGKRSTDDMPARDTARKKALESTEIQSAKAE